MLTKRVIWVSRMNMQCRKHVDQKRVVEGISKKKEETHASEEKKEKKETIINGQRMRRKASDEWVSLNKKQRSNPKYDAGTMKSEGRDQERKPGTPKSMQMQMQGRKIHDGADASM